MPSGAHSPAAPTSVPGPAPPARRGGSDALLAVAVGLAAWLLYRATAPAQVNLDGLGYLKLLRHNFSAGHLLYLPLLRAAAARPFASPLDAARAVSAVSAAAAVALSYATSRRS